MNFVFENEIHVFISVSRLSGVLLVYHLGSVITICKAGFTSNYTIYGHTMEQRVCDHETFVCRCVRDLIVMHDSRCKRSLMTEKRQSVRGKE